MYEPRLNPVERYRFDGGPQIEFPRPLVPLVRSRVDPHSRSAFAGARLEGAGGRERPGFLFWYPQPARL